MHYRVIIVGAGVVGLGAAWRLAQKRVGPVLVLEQRFPAAGGSGLGAGSVHCQRWRDGDINLILRTKQLIAQLSELTHGTVRLYETGRLTIVGDADARLLGTYVDNIRSNGIDIHELDNSDLDRRFPYLKSRDVGASAYTPSDGVLYPPALTWALAGVFRNAGGTIWEGVPAKRVVIDDGRAIGVEVGRSEVIKGDCVLVASGLWSAEVLKASGVALPLQRTLTQSAVVTLQERLVGWTVPNILDAIAGDMTVIPRNPGTVTVGRWIGAPVTNAATAGSEFGADVEDSYQDAVRDHLLIRFKEEYVGAAVGGWGGVVDVTPDKAPLIGPYPAVANLYVACGLGGYGIQRGPAVGEAVADMMLGASSLSTIEEYSLSRYPMDADFDAGVDSDNPFGASLRPAEVTTEKVTATNEGVR